MPEKARLQCNEAKKWPMDGHRRFDNEVHRSAGQKMKAKVGEIRFPRHKKGRWKWEAVGKWYIVRICSLGLVVVVRTASAKIGEGMI